MNLVHIAEHLYGSSGDGSLAVFLFVTLALGGSGAYLTGRAIAATWRPWWQLTAYVALLAAAVRFLDYALFKGPLLSPDSYAVDFVILAIFATLGFRTTRRAQLRHQYFWLQE
jgi:hypothetical protein